MKIKIKPDIPIFCELYGNTIRNKILSYFIALKDLDFAISDVAEDEKISKPKVYDEVEKLENQGFLIKSRKVAGTQLYKLNKDNEFTKLVFKSYQDSLNFEIDKAVENNENPKHSTTGSMRAVSMSAKHY